MLFSISVSFTNKNVNHIVIFELKKLKNKNTIEWPDELGVKLNGPVSSWNLDSGKSNVPGYTTETHSPLLAGTASSILNSSSHRMGVTPEIGTSRSGNLLLQALIEGKKSYFCCISSKFSCPRRCSLIGWIIIKLTIFISWQRKGVNII